MLKAMIKEQFKQLIVQLMQIKK